MDAQGATRTRGWHGRNMSLIMLRGGREHMITQRTLMLVAVLTLVLLVHLDQFVAVAIDTDWVPAAVQAIQLATDFECGANPCPRLPAYPLVVYFVLSILVAVVPAAVIATFARHENHHQNSLAVAPRGRLVSFLQRRKMGHQLGDSAPWLVLFAPHTGPLWFLTASLASPLIRRSPLIRQRTRHRRPARSGDGLTMSSESPPAEFCLQVASREVPLDFMPSPVSSSLDHSTTHHGSIARLGRDLLSPTVSWGLFHDLPNRLIGLSGREGAAFGQWQVNALPEIVMRSSRTRSRPPTIHTKSRCCGKSGLLGPGRPPADASVSVHFRC